MAKISPFKGLRFNTAVAGDPSAVITPPYDVIKPEEQESYYQKSPYNIIRLEYGLTTAEDQPSDNRYTRAHTTLQQWMNEKVLRFEAEKTFYVYEQTFSNLNHTYRRTALVAALQAEPYEKRSVLPHEETLQKPKTDRLELLRHCQANFSPIFGLYSDQSAEIGQILAAAKQSTPLVEISELDGIGHTLWGIPDPGNQGSLIKLMAPLPIYIADGHHRYETALAYAGESDLEQYPGRGCILSFLVSLQDPGLVILPTHRILSGLPADRASTLPHIAGENFQLMERGNPEILDFPAFMGELRELGENCPAMGIIMPDRTLLLQFNEASSEDNLDVSILKEHLLEPLFRGTGPTAYEEHISYMHDETKALQAVLSGDAQAAFILNPTPMDEVITRAARGVKMPQKSTYFYPKLPSGLVIHHLDLSH